MPNLLWRTHPRKFGKDSRECRRCRCQIGLIRKYDLLLCRKCFRENGEIIGFTKTRWHWYPSHINHSSIIINYCPLTALSFHIEYPHIIPLIRHQSSSVLFGNGLISLQFPNALPTLAQQFHAKRDNILLLVTEPGKKTAHQYCLILLQKLRRHVFQQISSTLERRLSHFCLRVSKRQF